MSTCSITRRVAFDLNNPGNPTRGVLVHNRCDCKSCCRRVSLYRSQVALTPEDTWAYEAIARVSWGDGCDGPVAEVDWKNGVTLDLHGTYTAVDLVVEFSTIDPGQDLAPIHFGAMSSCCGAGAPRGEATRTYTVVVPAPGDPSTAAVIAIPPFAYGVRTQFDSNITIRQLSNGNPNAARTVTGAGPLLANGYWPILNGSQAISVIRESGTGPLTQFVQFLIGI